ERLIICPIADLESAAQRLGIDDLGARTGIGHANTELGRLAMVFDRMAERIEHSVRALRTLSAGNRSLLHHDTEAGLLNAMCKVAVETGGYFHAVVHYADAEGKNPERKSEAGGDDDIRRIDWNDGPVTLAMKTGHAVVVNDISSDARLAAW